MQHSKEDEGHKSDKDYWESAFTGNLRQQRRLQPTQHT